MTQSTLAGKPAPSPHREPLQVRDLSGITLQEWLHLHDIRWSYHPDAYKPSPEKNNSSFCHCRGCMKPSEMDIFGMWGLCPLHWQEYKMLYEKEAGL